MSLCHYVTKSLSHYVTKSTSHYLTFHQVAKSVLCISACMEVCFLISCMSVLGKCRCPFSFFCISMSHISGICMCVTVFVDVSVSQVCYPQVTSRQDRYRRIIFPLVGFPGVWTGFWVSRLLGLRFSCNHCFTCHWISFPYSISAYMKVSFLSYSCH